MILCFLILAATQLWGKKHVSKVGAIGAQTGKTDSTVTHNHTNGVPHHTVAHLIDSISEALNCRIKVKEAKISTTLNARPAILTMFGKRENRKYIIRVNNRQNFKGIYNHEVPLPARDGLWVHELMHIKDYQARSTWGILQRGVQYLTKKGRKVFEHEIDRMVVMHGYGDALYQWAQYIMHESDACDSYKAYKQAIYLTPAQIKIEMGHSAVLADE